MGDFTFIELDDDTVEYQPVVEIDDEKRSDRIKLDVECLEDENSPLLTQQCKNELDELKG